MQELLIASFLGFPPLFYIEVVLPKLHTDCIHRQSDTPPGEYHLIMCFFLPFCFHPGTSDLTTTGDVLMSLTIPPPNKFGGVHLLDGVLL